jgi:hypothetical protein
MGEEGKERAHHRYGRGRKGKGEQTNRKQRAQRQDRHGSEKRARGRLEDHRLHKSGGKSNDSQLMFAEDKEKGKKEKTLVQVQNMLQTINVKNKTKNIYGKNPQ